MNIYLITNKINNKKYVGQTTKAAEFRWRQHVNDSKDKNKHSKVYSPLHRAIAKYGEDTFFLEVIAKVSNREELNYLEEIKIMELNTLVPFGYNIRPGGNCSEILPETRAKMSAASCRNAQNPAYIEKLRQAGKRLVQDPAYIEKLRVASTGRIKGPEERAKLSASLKGKVKSKEHGLAISKAKKGKIPNRTEETVQKSRERLIKLNKERYADRWFEVFDVFGKSLGKYNSYKTCAEALQVFPEQIERWLNGKVKSTKYRLALLDNQTGIASSLVFGACEVIQAFHSSGRLIGEFRTRAECAKFLNISHTSVGKCLLGKLKMKNYSFSIKKNEATL